MPAQAQFAPDGSIRGYVRDELGAVVPGVTIVAVSDAVPDKRSAVTDDTGAYRLSNLPPATYAVHAERDGFTPVTRNNVVVRAGLNIGLDIVMPIGTVRDTVNVRVDTPMLETSSPVQATNISGDMQRAVPLSTRNAWSDFMRLVPGVTTEESGRSLSFYVNGASLASHVFQVDGADVTSVLQGSALYLTMSKEAVADVQVKTSAIDASAPLGLGAVVNIAATSGSDRLRGTATYTRQPRRWNANNNPGGVAREVAIAESSVSLGGPVWRDRVRAFGAYQYTDNSNQVARTPSQLASIRTVLPSFTPFETVEHGHALFVNGTAQLSRHQVGGTFIEDELEEGSQAVDLTGPYLRFRNGGPVGSVRVSSAWTDRFLTRALFSYNAKGGHNTTDPANRTARRVYERATPASGRLMGTGLIASLDNTGSTDLLLDASKPTIAFDATYYGARWLGSHDVQFGVFVQPRLRDRRQTTYHGNGFHVEDLTYRDPDDPNKGLVPFHRQIYDESGVMTQFVDSRDTAVYVQDAWRPRRNVTISAGLRVDYVQRTDRIFDETTQRSREIGPRLGLNYLLTQDGRNAVRASWSRLHDNLSANPTSAGSIVVASRDLYDLDLDGVFETTFTTPARTAVATDRLFDLDGYHQGRADEWAVGYRRQWPRQIAMDVSLTRREFRNRPTGVETNAIYDGSVFTGYRDERVNEVFLVTSNRWNWPVYTGLEWRVAKQSATLQLIASYRRQWHHIAGTWQPNDPASFIQPDAFPNHGGIGESRGTIGTVNSLSGSDMATDNNSWRDHAGSIGAAYAGPWNLLVAGSYNVRSGVWSGPIVTRLAAGDPAFGPATITLSDGRLASNPLATPIRFAYATRGDHQFASPAVHELNIRVGRLFRLGPSKLEVMLDVANVGNAGRNTRVAAGASQLYNPQFGATDGRQAPRTGQLTLRFAF